MVFEASATESLDTFGNKYTLTIQQLKWICVGLSALLFTAHIPPKFWQKIAPFVYFGGLILLFGIFIPGLGVRVNGAHRWVSLAGFRFQPVEVMKLGIVLYFSLWLSKHQRLAPFALLTLLPITLVMLQPDLGSTLILVCTSFGMYFMANAPLKPLIWASGAGIVAIMVLIFSSPYRLERVRTYLDPSLDPLDQGYHVRQITLALGNGGLLGRGLGQSKQKYRYIPELSTDSIFAIVAEETGLIGSLILIGLFAVIISTSYQITLQLPEQSFESLMAAGITCWLTSQILLNLSAVVAIVPLTGIPLPLISRGGTSLVTILTGFGILIALSKHQAHSSSPPQKSVRTFSKIHLEPRKTVQIRK